MDKLRKPGRNRLAAVAAAVLAAGAIASLAATGYAARLVSFTHTSPTAAQYPNEKVTICHHTHSQKNPTVTITVSVHALPAHLKHGDTEGACAPTAPTTPTVAPVKQKTLKQKHNNGKKGQLHGHGKTAKPAKTHGKSDQAHGQNTAPSTVVHGKGHEKTHGASTKSHGQGKGHQKTNGSTKSHGQGKGHEKTHGQGHGQGQGQGGTHVNNSGGKGKGHKP